MLIDSLTIQRRIIWQFPGLGALHAWSARQPWSQGDEAAIMRVPPRVDPGPMVDAARQLIASYLDGPLVAITDSRKIWPDKARQAHPKEWIRHTIGFEIGWDQFPDTYQFRECIAASLREQPRLFIVESRTAEDVAEIQRLSEWCSKLPSPVAFACLTWTTAPVYPGIDGAVVIDARAGTPLESLSNLWSAQFDRDAFAVFLLYRIAWEAGGQLDIVSHYERRLSHLIDHSADDTGIEAVFADVAAEVLGPSYQDINELLEFLERQWTGGNADTLEAESRRLVDLGLLWRPAGVGDPMIPGWLARQIAPRLPHRRGPWALRRYLHCLPLTAAISERCIQLELTLREKLFPNLGPCSIPNALEYIAHWHEGKDRMRFTIYPPAHPARPKGNEGELERDAWLFADLGDAQKAAAQLRPRQNSSDVIAALTLIRNATAHGHPPSWAQIRGLRRLGNQIERA